MKRTCFNSFLMSNNNGKRVAKTIHTLREIKKSVGKRIRIVVSIHKLSMQEERACILMSVSSTHLFKRPFFWLEAYNNIFYCP